MTSTPNVPPWGDRAHVSVAEAAEILSRSQTWVRNRIVSRALRGVRAHEDGPLRVTTDSIISLIDRTAGNEEGSVEFPRRRPPSLRLVIDNTK